MAAFEIRAAMPADVDAIRRVVIDAYQPYVERIGRAPAPMLADYAVVVDRDHVFVAEAEGAVIGVLVLCRRRDWLLLDNVAVSRQRHGQGVGGALIRFAEGFARRGRYREIRLYTNAKMTKNLAMYPALGFTETGRRRSAGYDRVWFRKRLPPLDVDDAGAVERA